MMREYCMQCWRELKTPVELCPHCGRPPRPEAFEAKLIAALRHPRAAVRRLACVLLAQKDSTPAAVAALEAVAASDPDGYVREAALLALGELGEAESLPLLRQAAQHETLRARRAAALALSRLQRKRNETP